MKNGKKSLWDVLLIGGCLLLAAVLFLVFRFGQESGAGVIVRVGGGEVARYSLYQNGTYPLNGGSNTLVIENGEAWLIDANCPDELCVKQGKIRLNGQVITCLPNKLTVTVYGGEQNHVDLVS